MFRKNYYYFSCIIVSSKGFDSGTIELKYRIIEFADETWMSTGFITTNITKGNRFAMYSQSVDLGPNGYGCFQQCAAALIGGYRCMNKIILKPNK